MLIDALVVVALVGFGAAFDRLRQGGRAAAATVAAVVVAGLSTVWWETTHQPRIPFDAGYFHDQLYPAVLHLQDVGQQVIGRFGLVDIPLPIAPTAAWAVALAALGVLAVVRSSMRERLVLGGQVTALIGVTVFVTAGILRQYGFDLQGRHVLALAVTVPLLMGEIVRRRLAGAPRALGVGVAVVMATMAGAAHLAGFVRAGQAYGWLSSHRPANAWEPLGGRCRGPSLPSSARWPSPWARPSWPAPP